MSCRNSMANIEVEETKIISTKVEEDTLAKLSVLFVGDVMMHMPQINASKTDSGYNFDSVFVFVKEYIEAADIAICNLETTLAGEPYSGYPQFSAPDELVKTLKNTGFDIIATSNNHSADRGKLGIIRTVDIINEYNLRWMGTYKDSTQKDSLYPLILNVNNIKISLLNATYGTNGLPVPMPTIVNSLDTLQIKKDIEKVKEADVIIPYLHWGLEYERKQNNTQIELAKWLFSKGATTIVGSHPHVAQEVKYEKVGNDSFLVAYSLGNFVSNQRDRYKRSGMMIQLNYEKNLKSNQTTLSDFKVIPYHVHKTTNPIRYYILPLPIESSKIKIELPDTQLLNESYEDNMFQLKSK